MLFLACEKTTLARTSRKSGGACVFVVLTSRTTHWVIALGKDVRDQDMARSLTRKRQAGKRRSAEKTEVAWEEKEKGERATSGVAFASLQTAFVSSSRKTSHPFLSYVTLLHVARVIRDAFESHASSNQSSQLSNGVRRSSATSLNVLYAVKGSYES